MKVFICKTCQHIEFSNASEKCPSCLATEFMRNDNVFKESEEKSKEAAIKHIPAVTVKKECGMIPETGCTDVLVRIGKTLHPMEEKHFIQFIDCYVDGKYVLRTQLTPGVNPAACIHLKGTGSKVTIVENCNLHGFWMAEADL